MLRWRFLFEYFVELEFVAHEYERIRVIRRFDFFCDIVGIIVQVVIHGVKNGFFFIPDEEI